MTPELPAPYAAAWRRYRRRSRTFFALARGASLTQRCLHCALGKWDSGARLG